MRTSLASLILLLLLPPLMTGCVPRLLEYRVDAVQGSPRPVTWDPYEPTVITRDDLALTLSPVGLDTAGPRPILRLALVFRNRGDREALWTADPAHVTLAPGDGPALEGLTVETEHPRERRGEIASLIRVPPGKGAIFRLAVPVGETGPLPRTLQLRLASAPWGESLEVWFHAPARVVKAWNRRLGR
jgi:hypothetical protein